MNEFDYKRNKKMYVSYVCSYFTYKADQASVHQYIVFNAIWINTMGFDFFNYRIFENILGVFIFAIVAILVEPWIQDLVSIFFSIHKTAYDNNNGLNLHDCRPDTKSVI